MASEASDGPTQKRPRMVSYPNFRPAGYDFSKQHEKRDRSNLDPNRGPGVEHEPSPVVHLRSLSAKVVEVDIWTEMNKYGKVLNVFMIKQTGQALVEFDSVDSTTQLVELTRLTPIKICGGPVQISFSKSKKILTPVSKSEVERSEHNVLLLSIHHVMYPITVDVLHTICKPYGEVARIVIFRKGGTQAMVEFVNIADAVKAKKNLNGTFIYADCCSLRVDYGKADKLTVKVNNQDTWDFTPEGPVGVAAHDQPRVLLPNPTPVPGQQPQPPPQQQQQQQQQQSPPWGPGWGMGMGWGMGKSGDGVMGPGPSGGSGDRENGSKPLIGGWGNHAPPPPPPLEDDGESAHAQAFGYGKYGGNTGFPEPYGGGYGGPSGNGDAASPPTGPPGYPGYGTYPPNFAAMAMAGQSAPSAMPGAGGAGGGGPNENPHCVLMIYGLSANMNCDRVFNLICLYGNVVRIKFLRSKSDAAMIQMGDQEGCEELFNHLNGLSVFGKDLTVTRSKQPFLLEDRSSGELTDGSPAAKDYATNKCNRFLDPKGGALKRYAPHNIIHYYNAPPGFNDDDMKQAFETHGAVIPDVIKLLGTKNGKNSSGLMQWANQSDANDAMCLCNHMKLEELSSSIIPGKRPNSYTLKLCFSSVPTIG